MVSSKLEMFQISAYPALMPCKCSWYNCDKQVAIFPEPGPGAVTTTNGLEVII